MKIFNFLKGKDQTFIIGVLVFVLLISTVGVVSGESAADPNSNQVTSVGEFIHPTEDEYKVILNNLDIFGLTGDRIIIYPVRTVSLKYDSAGGQVSGVGEIEAKNSCFRLNLNMNFTGSASEIEMQSGKKVLHFQGEVEGTKTNSGRLCSDSRHNLLEPESTAGVETWKADWWGDLDYETGTITGQIDRMFYVAPLVQSYLEFELEGKEVPSEEKEEDCPLSITIMSDKQMLEQEAIYRPGETVIISEEKEAIYRPGETVIVSGFVYDGEGKTVKGATVSTQVTNPSGVMYPVVQKTTDEVGYYEVVIKLSDDAAIGKWKIAATASLEGYQEASETAYVELSEKALDIFVISDKEIYSRGDRAIIYGYVYDGEGKTVEGAKVSIRVLNPNNKPYTATETTDKYGRYEISNIFIDNAITGEWMIDVTASKNGYREKSAWWILYYVVKTGGIHSERMRLQNDYKNLTKGHILFSEGKVTKALGRAISLTWTKKPDYGHVGIYIGDFEADSYYIVGDKAQLPLKVYSDGKAISLTEVGDLIKPGDWIIGCVVEARGNGIVFNTVDGMKNEARRTMGGEPAFAWKTTNPPPNENEVDKIVKFALEKIELTQQGKIEYMFGKQGSTSIRTGKEQWDCVSLAIAAYDKAECFPAPLHLDDWVSVQPQELADYMSYFEPRSIQRAFNIIVESPVNLHLYDSQDRHVGFTSSGTFEKDIPNAYYYLEFEQHPQAIFVQNVDDEYTLVIQAVDSGSFNLKIQDLNVSRSDSLTKVEFLEVSITENTIATVYLGADHKDYRMSIDQDGDGKTDRTLEPTSLEVSPIDTWTVDVTGLAFESRSKPTGSNVQIPLTMNGIEEKIGNMDISISYDPSVLEATEVIKGSLTTNSIFDYNILNQGTIKISLADSQGFSGDGSIAYVKFNVIGSEFSSSPLQIAAIAANSAEDYEALEIPTFDGVFRVINMEEGMGDSDGDGRFTALDALYALQMAVGKIPEDLVMDMNGDGSVTSLDARNILKIAVGIESK